MTILSQTRNDLLRWSICGAVVVMAHAGLAAALVQWVEPLDTAEVTAAIVVELAPISAAPAPMTEDIPPGPEMVQAEAAPEKPVEVAKLEEPPEELKPEPEAEVALPPPEAKPEPPQPESAPPAPVTSAPQAVQMALASVPAAPTQGTPKPSDSTAIPTWRSRIAATLERNKRYPSEARQRRQQGVAQIAFTLDRKGYLVASHIVRGSGYASLDQESLQLLQRAQPFPPPPTELSGERVDLIVPVRFNLR
jgi:periplasmic protein TonB